MNLYSIKRSLKVSPFNKMRKKKNLHKIKEELKNTTSSNLQKNLKLKEI